MATLLDKELFPILNNQLSRYKDNWKDEIPYLYHATKKSNLPSIMKQGLLTSCFGKVHGEMSIRPKEQGVYLSRHETSNNLNMELFEGEDEVVILKIKTSNIDPSAIYPDDGLFCAFAQEEVFEDEEEVLATFDLPKEEAQKLFELFCESSDTELADVMRPLWPWYLSEHGEISVTHNVAPENIIGIFSYETGMSIDMKDYQSISNDIDLVLLQHLRDFMAPKWKARQIEMGQRKNIDDTAITDDKGMCRYSALFTVEALEAVTNSSWAVEGGDTWLPKYPNGGFKDGAGNWHGHYWASNGEIIIDLTANQFGDKKIVVALADDKRYLSNYDQGEINNHLSQVEDTVDEWLCEAMENNVFSITAREKADFYKDFES